MVIPATVSNVSFTKLVFAIKLLQLLRYCEPHEAATFIFTISLTNAGTFLTVLPVPTSQ